MMNREILFRGKRKSDGEWIEGYLVYIRDRAYIGFEKGSILLNVIEVLPETIGQYTGIKDKIGERIFDGDILESHYDKAHPEDYCYELAMRLDGGWHMQEVGCDDPDYLCTEDCRAYSEVVGNKWDTPELLGVSDNERT